MVMQLVIVFVAVAVIGVAALVAAGWFGQQQTEPVRDVYQPPLDGERLRGEDLEHVRFGLTPMGYDMAQVDEWMARMARELDRRDGAVGPGPGDRAPVDSVGTPRGSVPDAE